MSLNQLTDCNATVLANAEINILVGTHIKATPSKCAKCAGKSLLQSKARRNSVVKTANRSTGTKGAEQSTFTSPM